MPLPVPERLHLSHPGRRHRAPYTSTGALRARRGRETNRKNRNTSKCALRPRRVELHRLLTFLGVALLVATFAIYYGEGGYGGPGGDDEGPGGTAAGPSDGTAAGGFSMAYVTGIAMLAVFMASFVLFNKDRWGRSRR